MVMKNILSKLAGNPLEFPLEHRIFCLISIIGIMMAFTAAVINYFLDLGTLTVIVTFLCGLISIGLYYISLVKKIYNLPVYLILTFLSFIFFPIMWLINAGTYGSIPYYMIVQAGIIAILLTGSVRKLFIFLYMLTIGGLIITEYYFPHLVIGYDSSLVRYLDTSFGYYVSLFANIALFVVIINNYNRERELARQSEMKYRELADSLPEVIFECDLNGKLLYLNKNADALFGQKTVDLANANIFNFITPQDKTKAEIDIKELIRAEGGETKEYIVQDKKGRETPVLIKTTPIIRGDTIMGIRGLIIDITERKQNEKKLQYLSCYDSLTGLRNRHGFHQDIEYFLRAHPPARVGIIVIDVDGLKLVNDTIGHNMGDRLLKNLAGIIKDSVRQRDITARVGGDEFCIMVPLTNGHIMEDISHRLRKGIDEHNKSNPELPLSISLGFAISPDSKVDIEALFKEADDYMYRQKIHRTLSNRSAYIRTLMKAVEERDFITSGHAKRLDQYVCAMANAMGLTNRQSDDLRLLAKFHDVGKVGIPDGILFKPGPLSKEEKKELERHCEIGYRIALSAPGLSSIADLILKHHEWWNGKGYPLKLKGEEIPLLCRILAIGDAYDAMTSPRPYRSARSHREAIYEIKKNAGVQFDPDLVQIFLQSVFNSGGRQTQSEKSP